MSKGRHLKAAYFHVRPKASPCRIEYGLIAAGIAPRAARSSWVALRQKSFCAAAISSSECLEGVISGHRSISNQCPSIASLLVLGRVDFSNITARELHDRRSAASDVVGLN
jgi:hypothetical protein